MENQPKIPCPPREEIFRHYGYPEDTPDKDVGIGLWDKSDALDRLAKLPEMLPYLDGNKKIRVVFDYDPDFPKALLQITGLKDNDCVHRGTFKILGRVPADLKADKHRGLWNKTRHLRL